jgi:hypothetical protein
MRVGLLWACGALLVGLHLWPPFDGVSHGGLPGGSAPQLVLGLLPGELAYRLAWMVLATLYVVVVTARPRAGET